MAMPRGKLADEKKTFQDCDVMVNGLAAQMQFVAERGDIEQFSCAEGEKLKQPAIRFAENGRRGAVERPFAG